MERKFYYIMKVLRNHSNDKEQFLILQIFPNSPINDHLVDKLTYAIERLGYYDGIFSFYENLDKAHKAQFDAWIESEIATINQPVD